MAGLALVLAMLPAAHQVHALEPEERGAVEQAFRDAARGEWERVGRLLELVDDPLPGKTLRWLRMIEDGEPADFATLAGFLMANPQWPLPERLQEIAENTITDPADHALIRRFFEDRAPRTTRGHIRYAQALFDVGERQRAIELIRWAWINGDFSAREDRRFYRQYRRYLREQDHIARLDGLLWDYRRGSAQRMLERVPVGYRRLAEARMRLQRRQGGVDRAIEAVPAALRDDPGLTFDRLNWRRNRRLYDGVQEILLDPPPALGRPDRWWFERELEIRRALRGRDFDLAYRLAGLHGQIEGIDFAEAEWLAGWLALRHADQPDAAFRRFIRMHEAVSSPISRSRAAYWAGRAAAALGDRALARYWYQAAARHRVTYYGQLAASELEEPPPAAAAPAPSADQRAAFESGELTRVVRMLVEVGADDELQPFAMHLARVAKSPTEIGMVADLIAESGRADLVTRAGRYAAYLGQVNEAAAFPIPELDDLLVQQDGAPEPALLLGVARQESVFNTWGVSRAGARGLLQLMPGTAHLMARALRIPYSRARLTADPSYNIRLGRYYLRRLLDRYDDEVVLAMSAYNAGPRRVDQWLELNGDPRRGDAYALIDWVELIPFGETRNYVQRVIEGRNLYRQRLAEKGVAMVCFRAVGGSLRSLPSPQLKPLGEAHEAHEADVAAVAAQAPRPKLKPLTLESSLAPLGRDIAATPVAQARPMLARLAAAAPEALAEAPTVVVSPDLEPGSLAGTEAPLPQPELKPKGR